MLHVSDEHRDYYDMKQIDKLNKGHWSKRLLMNARIIEHDIEVPDSIGSRDDLLGFINHIADHDVDVYKCRLLIDDMSRICSRSPFILGDHELRLVGSNGEYLLELDYANNFADMLHGTMVYDIWQGKK
ncbi:hypothetical protein [Vibrio algicola]|uniref:Uncharacterized protein n=1 Tax=Vibrio algicola TaxID=2662262 RepID=A0A5Q0TH99_9VIBR|nr:hypothetical protein [Vibrio algicola]